VVDLLSVSELSGFKMMVQVIAVLSMVVVLTAGGTEKGIATLNCFIVT